jgi:uncharacterized protein
MADFKIDNNSLACRFEAIVAGGLAVLDYRIERDTIFLLYVEVPPTQRGHGIAGKLSHAALEFARDSGLKVVAKCPYIAAYARRHPELLNTVL